jgi:methionyl-tRNA formyltransferase
MPFNILFLGTPEFSVPTLEMLLNDFGDANLSVVTMPDKIRGRGSKSSPSPVKSLALAHNLTVFNAETKHDLTDKIHKISPDLIVVVAFGMIIEKKITDQYFCINIHSSLLPKYRGASPIHTALLNGDEETGITLIKMNEKMDEGDILSQVHLPISSDDNLGSLTQKLSYLGAETLKSFILNHFLANSITLTAQDETRATYTKKIEKDDLLITHMDSGVNLHNKIRAYSPKPGAYIVHNDRRIKLLTSRMNNGQFSLLKVQPEGKAAMSYTDFLLGSPEGINL